MTSRDILAWLDDEQKKPHRWTRSDSGGKVFDLVNYLWRQRRFSLQVFGPHDGTGPVDYRSILNHIEKELGEIRASEGRDLEEWIDVATLAFDGAWRCALVSDPERALIPGAATGKASPEHIAQALFDKLQKNIGRSWPDWRKKKADGTAIEHVRTVPVELPSPLETVQKLHHDAVIEREDWKKRWHDENAERERMVSELQRTINQHHAQLEALRGVINIHLQERDQLSQQLTHYEHQRRQTEDILRENEGTIAMLREMLAVDRRRAGELEERNIAAAADITRLATAIFNHQRVCPLTPTDIPPSDAPRHQRPTGAAPGYIPPTPPRHPGDRDYYGGTDNHYEAIKVIEACGLGFNLGNVVKYILRPMKSIFLTNRIEDLEKAVWYLQREISELRRRLPQTGAGPDDRAQQAQPAAPGSGSGATGGGARPFSSSGSASPAGGDRR